MVTPFRLAAPFTAFAGDERRRANRTCTPSDCGGAAAKRRTAGKAFLSREEWRLCRQGKKVESRRCRTGAFTRSEEHTSELPSLMRISYAVFCLEKKTSHQHDHTTILSVTITLLTL